MSDDMDPEMLHVGKPLANTCHVPIVPATLPQLLSVPLTDS
jgi:hypothetical protein